MTTDKPAAMREAKHRINFCKSELLRIARDLESAKVHGKAKSLRTIINRLEDWQKA